MGSNDEFGPDTETIRAWLNKRASYANDARIVGTPRGGTIASSTPPEAAPTPVDPMTAPAAPPVAGPDHLAAGRSIVDALRDAPPADAHGAAPRPSGIDSTDLGRSVVDALRATPPPAGRPSPAPSSRAKPPAAPPRREPTASRRPRPTPPRVAEPAAEGVDPLQQPGGPQIVRGNWTEPEEHRDALQASTDVDFPVRAGVRRTLSIILLLTLAGTAAAGYLVWRAEEPEPTSIGILVVLGVLTLVVWAVRAGCVTTQLSIHRGQLSVKRAGHTEVVDIGSDYTPIAIVGEPGQRRWTVLVERPGRPLLVITPSIVDPHWFTSALYRVRPELRPGMSDGYGTDHADHPDLGYADDDYARSWG